MMQIILPLSRGMEAVIDEADKDLAKYKWYAAQRGGNVYAARNTYLEDGRRTVVLLHAVILRRKLGRDLMGGELCDHVNGDGLDNRRANVRSATPWQNLANSKLSKRNTTGFKGVRRLPSGRYCAEISARGHRRRLGTHDTPEAAYAAYCHAAQELFGIFARPECRVALG